MGGILHFQRKFSKLGDDYGGGLYVTPAAQFGPYTAFGATGTLVLGNEPDDGGGWDANLTGSIFSKGQLAYASSPLFANLWSLGGLYTWGESSKSPSRSNANEVYLNYYHGSATTQTDQSAPATGNAVRVGYGHNWQWNWKQGEDQYNGLGLYIGAALEVDVIKRDAYENLPSSKQIPVSALIFGSISIGSTKR